MFLSKWHIFIWKKQTPKTWWNVYFNFSVFPRIAPLPWSLPTCVLSAYLISNIIKGKRGLPVTGLLHSLLYKYIHIYVCVYSFSPAEKCNNPFSSYQFIAVQYCTKTGSELQWALNAVNKWPFALWCSLMYIWLLELWSLTLYSSLLLLILQVTCLVSFFWDE